MVVNQHQGILKVVLDDFGNTAEMLKEQRRARLDPTGHIVFLKGSSYLDATSWSKEISWTNH